MRVTNRTLTINWVEPFTDDIGAAKKAAEEQTTTQAAKFFGHERFTSEFHHRTDFMLDALQEVGLHTAADFVELDLADYGG